MRSLSALMFLNPLSANLTSGQTHSNNSSAVADELLSVFHHFMGLMSKVFKTI